MVIKKMPKRQSNRKRTKSASPNAPRLDPHERLLYRFYEPLILLCTLGRTRGEHQRANFPTSTDITSWPSKYIRRLFLNQLAFLSDFDTGGDSVTAIGIQNAPEKRTFWISANICPDNKIVPFIRNCLLRLKTAAQSLEPDHDAMERFLAACVEHARPRIKAYLSFFRRLMLACHADIEEKAAKDEHCKVLLAWLQHLQSGNVDLVEICKLAYNSRRSAEMYTLKHLSGGIRDQRGKKSLQAKYMLLRHYIGRLGQYVKVVQTLFQSAPRLIVLFDNFEVCSRIPPTRIPPPAADGKTTLDSIAIRMLPAQSPDLAHYQIALSELDSRFNLFARFMEIYSDNNFKPRVHAEVQLLDFFHKTDLKFEDGDVFIGCSKPACFCCLLYFQHHPLRPALPASHQTIHRNWRPPDSTPGVSTQRDILNRIIKDVRTEVLYQIDQRRPNAQWHPDSTTGITGSTSYINDEDILEQINESRGLSENFGEQDLFIMPHSDLDCFAENVSSDAGSRISQDQIQDQGHCSLYEEGPSDASDIDLDSISECDSGFAIGGGVLLSSAQPFIV